MPAQHLLLVASAALVGVLEFGGVPIPGGPLLVALSATVTDPATAVLTTLAAALGAMCADAIWFTIGRRRGLALVHAYCRFTLGSRECAATTTRFFQRLGPRALIIGKFVPGLAAFGAPFAGLAGVSWGRFLAWDLVGSLLWASAWVAAGRTLGRPLLAQVAARSGGLQVVLIALVVVPAALVLAGRLWRQGAAAACNAVSEQSLNPRAMAAHFEFYKSVMFQPSSLSRRDREAIAVAVSRANGCEYCIAHHAAALEALPGMPTDPRLLAWADRLARDPASASDADVRDLRALGLDDRAILDAILTVGYFCFVNRLVLATGLAVEAGFQTTCRPDLAD